jgi:SsrA-binding protein
MAKKSKSKTPPSVMVVNKKAAFDYFIDERYEGGLALQGWEVKALRAGKVQLRDSFIRLYRNEAYLFNCVINPLPQASTHVNPEPSRSRKVLLHRRELDKLIGLVERKGYTLAALNLHWKRGRAKVEIGVARGKKQHDKRQTIKEREWKREQGRVLKGGR